MKTYIYEGGLGIVAKSGVGSAIKHQKNMLKQADIEEAKSWKRGRYHTYEYRISGFRAGSLSGKNAGKESCLLRSFNDGGLPKLFYRLQPFCISF